jgi:hypothetical protein
LQTKFCIAFFPISQVAQLHRGVLNFQQKEKETLGVAWAHFSDIISSGPDLTIPDLILLQHIYLGLSKETSHYLDITFKALFFHLSSIGGKDVLNKIAENTPYTSIHDECPKIDDYQPQELEALEAKASTPSLTQPSSSLPEPTPEPITKPLEEEEESPLEFPFEIEDNLFEDFGNVKNYPLQAKPSSRQRLDLSDEKFSREDLQDLSTILSHEWTMRAEVVENVL